MTTSCPGSTSQTVRSREGESHRAFCGAAEKRPHHRARLALLAGPRRWKPPQVTVGLARGRGRSAATLPRHHGATRRPLKPSRSTPTLRAGRAAPVGAEPNDESEERVMGKKKDEKKDKKTEKKDKKARKAKSAQDAPRAAETAVAPSASPRRKKS